MYRIRPILTLGFHGCDQTTVTKVLSGNEPLKASYNKYDWLGHGIYFWDGSPSRALEYATFLKNNPSRARTPIITPAVIGAVISLGDCLDLIDYSNLLLLKEGYDAMKALQKFGYVLPHNRNAGNNKDLLLRELDCSVMKYSIDLGIKLSYRHLILSAACSGKETAYTQTQASVKRTTSNSASATPTA